MPLSIVKAHEVKLTAWLSDHAILSTQQEEVELVLVIDEEGNVHTELNVGPGHMLPDSDRTSVETHKMHLSREVFAAFLKLGLALEPQVRAAWTFLGSPREQEAEDVATATVAWD